MISVFGQAGVTLLGDGTSTQVKLDLRDYSEASRIQLAAGKPNFVFLQSFGGSPSPAPNVTSVSISGFLITVNFSMPLVLFNPSVSLTDGTYSFSLGFGLPTS